MSARGCRCPGYEPGDKNAQFCSNCRKRYFNARAFLLGGNVSYLAAAEEPWAAVFGQGQPNQSCMWFDERKGTAHCTQQPFGMKLCPACGLKMTAKSFARHRELCQHAAGPSSSTAPAPAATDAAATTAAVDTDIDAAELIQSVFTEVAEVTDELRAAEAGNNPEVVHTAGEIRRLKTELGILGVHLSASDYVGMSTASNASVTVPVSKACDVLIMVSEVGLVQHVPTRAGPGVSVLRGGSLRSLREHLLLHNPLHLYVLTHTDTDPACERAAHLCFADGDGTEVAAGYRLATPTQFVELCTAVKRVPGQRLESVFLNGCVTHEIAAALAKDAKIARAIGWPCPVPVDVATAVGGEYLRWLREQPIDVSLELANTALADLFQGMFPRYAWGEPCRPGLPPLERPVLYLSGTSQAEKIRDLAAEAASLGVHHWTIPLSLQAQLKPVPAPALAPAPAVTLLSAPTLPPAPSLPTVNVNESQRTPFRPLSVASTPMQAAGSKKPTARLGTPPGRPSLALQKQREKAAMRKLS